MKLSSWFEIDDIDYCQYVLQGYEITANEHWVKWLLNGKYHRTDGPATIHSDGTREWYLNGKYHRTDGPAIIWEDGDEAWYLNGRGLTEKAWRSQIETRELV